MSKEEITKHKSETHEVAVALPALRSFSEGGSRACPELAAALSVPVLSFIEGVEGVVEWTEGVAEWTCLQPPAEISSHTSHCKV